jgi:hypothetical protein
MGNAPSVPSGTLTLQFQIGDVLREQGWGRSANIGEKIAKVMGTDPPQTPIREPEGGSIHDAWWLGPPAGVIQAVVSVLSGGYYDRALDAWAGGGFLLSAIRECGLAGPGVAVAPNVNAATVSAAMGAKFGFESVCADPLRWMDSGVGMFDLVVASIPWGAETKSASIHTDKGNVELRDDLGHILLAKASGLLKPDGIGVFAVSPSFFLRRGSLRVADQLSRIGLRIDALFFLPKGAFSPWTSIRGALAAIRPGEGSDLFVGELSGVPDRDLVLLDNWKKRRRGADSGLGRLVQWSTFRGFESLQAEEQVQLLGKRLGYESVTMRDLVLEVRLTKESTPPGFEDLPNAVYLPMIGMSRVVTSTGELRLKPHNYAQLILNAETVHPSYLAGYLNSPLGTLSRRQQFSGAIISKLNREGLRDIRVFLPTLEEQKKLAELNARLAELESDLSERRTRLWSDPRSFKRTEQLVSHLTREETFVEWLDHLPYPLASILWAYHAAGSDDRKRYEHLLHFFEALSEFLAVILLSGVRTGTAFGPEVLGEEMPKALLTGHLSLREASFGTWNCIFSFLAKKFRTLLNGGGDKKAQAASTLRTSDDAVQEMLTSPDLVAILQEAGHLRNLWHGHGGAVSPREANDRHLKLKDLLSRVRRVFGTAWDRFEAVIPGPSRFAGGRFTYTVRRAVGRAFPFAESEAELTEPMEDGSLHFLGAGESRALKVLPFVRFGRSPDATQSACYFYNRGQKGQIRFVSYHFEDKAELVEANPETERLLADLSGSGDSPNQRPG